MRNTNSGVYANFRARPSKQMKRGVRLQGKLIRTLRLSKGWSQLDLAERAGVGERTIRNAESGRIIEGSTALYVAGALDVELEQLLHFRNSVNSDIHLRIADTFQKAVLLGAYLEFCSLLHEKVNWNFFCLPLRMRKNARGIMQTQCLLGELSTNEHVRELLSLKLQKVNVFRSESRVRAELVYCNPENSADFGHTHLLYIDSLNSQIIYLDQLIVG